MADKHGNCIHICGRKTTQKHMQSWKENMRWVLKKRNERAWTELIWLRTKIQGRTLMSAVINLQVSYVAGFFMRVKPTSAYEKMRMYYTIAVVGPLNISATYCGHLQEDVFRMIYYK
jgi:hypothetical protein